MITKLGFNIVPRYMEMALIEATKSVDPSTQNGALVVTPNADYTWAHNKLPLGTKITKERFERPLKYKFFEHAERGAIYCAARKGMPTDEAVMYCPWAACSDCARAIIQSGIDALVRFPIGDAFLNHWYDDCMVGDEMMKEARITIIEYDFKEIKIPKLRRGGKIWPDEF